MLVSDIQIGSKYNFQTLAPSVLSLQYTGVKVIGVGDYMVANQYTDIVTLFNAVYPYLPNGTPANYKDHTYFILSDRTVVSKYWINEASLAVFSGITADIRLNLTSTDTLQQVVQALQLMGITDFTTTIVP